MDFAKYDVNESFARARLSPQDQQNRDETKRLQDDVLSAIERLERQSLPLAIARPIRPSVFDRADVSELISNLHFSPTTSSFSRWKFLGIRVIVGVVSAGFAIGVVSIAANTEWLALTDFLGYPLACIVNWSVVRCWRGRDHANPRAKRDNRAGSNREPIKPSRSLGKSANHILRSTYVAFVGHEHLRSMPIRLESAIDLFALEHQCRLLDILVEGIRRVDKCHADQRP